jgi:DNA-binding transcriptional ArsR family regulator
MSKATEMAVANLFFALGDGTRLAVVKRLSAAGALSATSLAGGAKVTRQAIVKHLRVLHGAGLVTHEKRGREVLYALEARRFAEARAFLDGVSAGWDRAIERLRRIVEGPPKTPIAPRRSAATRRLPARRSTACRN